MHGVPETHRSLPAALRDHERLVSRRWNCADQPYNEITNPLAAFQEISRLALRDSKTVLEAQSSQTISARSGTSQMSIFTGGYATKVYWVAAVLMMNSLDISLLNSWMASNPVQ